MVVQNMTSPVYDRLLFKVTDKCGIPGEETAQAAAGTAKRERQANTHLPTKDQFTVTPHVLRHTFLRKLAETKGVQYAKEASGHKTDCYIWRYVKPDRQTLVEAIDQLE